MCRASHASSIIEPYSLSTFCPCISAMHPFIYIALLYWIENNGLYWIWQIHKLQACSEKQKTIISGQGWQQERRYDLAGKIEAALNGNCYVLWMNEYFTDEVMAEKLLRGMLVFCDVRIPSASGSPLSLEGNWVSTAASHYSFPISLQHSWKDYCTHLTIKHRSRWNESLTCKTSALFLKIWQYFG